MFGKLLKEYQKKSRRTVFISQLGAFLVSIFALLSLYDLVEFYNANYRHLRDFIEVYGLLSAVFFQVSIMLIFGARFVLTFFKKEKIFWVNRILWLVGFSLLLSYRYNSRPLQGTFGIYSTYESLFRHASRYFDSFGFWYLVLIQIRQVIILFCSFLTSRNSASYPVKSENG